MGYMVRLNVWRQHCPDQLQSDTVIKNCMGYITHTITETGIETSTNTDIRHYGGDLAAHCYPLPCSW